MIMQNAFLFYFLIFFTGTIVAQQYNQFDADGKRHGKWRKRYDNSDQIRYEGAFDHGKEIGEFKFYKPSSGNDSPTATKTFFKNNDTIRMKYFTAKGKVISEGGMIGKVRVGKWVYYHNGSTKIMMTEHYNPNGKLTGEQATYFDNGKLTEKTMFVDGKRQGKRVMYSEKGTLLKEFFYENDKLHGLTKYYDTEGNLIIEGNYKRDRKDGIWKYYEKGKLKEEKSFPKGKS